MGPTASRWMARLGKEWMEVDDNGLVDESGRRLGFDKFGRGRGNDDGDALVERWPVMSMRVVRFACFSRINSSLCCFSSDAAEAGDDWIVALWVIFPQLVYTAGEVGL